MVRLLGRNPVDVVIDRRVAEVFAASHALRPVGKPFDALLSEMSEPAQEDYVKEIVAMWPDLSHKSEREQARQSLIDMVEGEFERVRAIAAEFEENAGEDAVRMRASRRLCIPRRPKGCGGGLFEPRTRWSAGARCYGRRYGRGRRIAMRRHCRRCLGKILAYQYDGRPGVVVEGGGGGSGRVESSGRKGAVSEGDRGTGGRETSGGRRVRSGVSRQDSDGAEQVTCENAGPIAGSGSGIGG